MKINPRHPECLQCRKFDPERLNRHCLPCGAGEFFEEKVDDDSPDDQDLMGMYEGMMDNDES